MPGHEILGGDVDSRSGNWLSTGEASRSLGLVGDSGSAETRGIRLPHTVARALLAHGLSRRPDMAGSVPVRQLREINALHHGGAGHRVSEGGQQGSGIDPGWTKRKLLAQ